MSVTVNGHIIGDRVGTEMMTRLLDDELYSAFYSKIEVDGRMVLIRDNSYKTGQVHAKTRKEAKALAIEARDRIFEKELARSAIVSTAQPSHEVAGAV